MMCTKTNPNVIKCVVGVAIMILFGVISISLYFGLEGGEESNVVMNGDKNKSRVQQSVGVHLLEVNNSGDTGDCKGSRSYAEYAVVLLVFVIILKCSHLCHHCIWTKTRRGRPR